MGDEASKQRRVDAVPSATKKTPKTAAARAAAKGANPQRGGAAPSKLSDAATTSQRKDPPSAQAAESKKASPSTKCMAYKSLERDIVHKMRTLCNDSTNHSLCDCTWSIGKRKVVFHAVAALFAIHSPDLDRILKEHKAEPIVFEDITPDVFRFVRQYFYSLNPVISLENIADIFYAAQKWNISHLIAAAKQFVDEISEINDLVLVLSQLHARKLSDECDRIIASRHLLEERAAIKVLQCENLKTLPTELMIRLLRHDGIKMAEETIFERCATWAQWKEKVAVANKSGQESISLVTTEEAAIEGWDEEEETDWKQIIQPLLPHIRFPVMNGEYFTSHVVDMKILSTDDCTLIMQFLFTQKENDNLKYSTKKRVTPTPTNKAADSR